MQALNVRNNRHNFRTPFAQQRPCFDCPPSSDNSFLSINQANWRTSCLELAELPDKKIRCWKRQKNECHSFQIAKEEKRKKNFQKYVIQSFPGKLWRKWISIQCKTRKRIQVWVEPRKIWDSNRVSNPVSFSSRGIWPIRVPQGRESSRL